MHFIGLVECPVSHCRSSVHAYRMYYIDISTDGISFTKIKIHGPFDGRFDSLTGNETRDTSSGASHNPKGIDVNT